MFDFLFQNFEGVLSLTKRKARILTILSLAGLLVAVVFAAIFAFNVDTLKYIPGIISLGVIFVFNVIFLLRGKYNAAVRSIYLLPVTIYLFYIAEAFLITQQEYVLHGILRLLYFGFLYLLVFSYSVKAILIYFAEAVLVLVYYYLAKGDINDAFGFANITVLGVGNPFVELTIVAGLQTFFFVFYDSQITHSVKEYISLQKRLNDSLRLTNMGVMALKIRRDEFNEKSGMTILNTNPTFEKAFKISKEEIQGADFSDIFPKIFQDSFNWQEVFFHSMQPNIQVYFEHLDRWFLINNISPEPDLIVCSFQDVTSLMQEINRLNLREKRLTTLLGSLPDIFFIIEKDGTYVDYVSNNPDLMRISQEDIIGKTIFQMGFSSEMSQQIHNSIQHVLKEDNIETIEYGMELSSGKSLVFEMRLARLNENQIISIGRDITAKKEYQMELVEAKLKTEEASRLKASFLENISHEMRTPMNAILGFSNLAIDNQFEQAERENFLRIVIENGENLMDILTNLIDISEIETGSLQVRMETCRVNDIFEELHEKIERINKKSTKNVEFEMELGSSYSKYEIYSDRYLLEKVLSHLVDNALKFTKEGKVVFGYELAGDRIKFYVKDSGIGISEEDRQNIYERFHQSHNQTNRRYGGTGIGLTIVKSLIELLGGNIEFESKQGVGTTFYFYLPSNNYLRLVK